MELLSHPAVAVVLLLGILVIVHEAGHFVVGKLFRIPVEIFSVGFGPVLFGFRRKETEYRISAVPLGGFVKFYGSVPSDVVPEELRGSEFYKASKTARLLTIAAGPMANFLLAVFVFAGMVMYGLRQPPPTIGEVLPNSPAERAGITFGDTVLNIDGVPVHTWRDVQRIIAKSARKNLRFQIMRGQKTLELTLAPEEIKDEDLPGQKGRIGISRVMTPAVMTEVNSQGFFTKAGLKTGDRFVEVEWNGQNIEIKYWRQLIDFMRNISRSGATLNQQLEIKFYIDHFEPNPSDEAYVVQSGKLRLVKVEIPKGWLFNMSNFELTSGIAHSQLTIFKVDSTIKNLFQGDRILKWEGKILEGALDLSTVIASHTAPVAKISLLRDGKIFEEVVGLSAAEVQKAEGRATMYSLPVQFWGAMEQPEWILEKYENPFMALGYGLRETWDMTRQIARAMGGLLTGEMPLTTLGGPIAIAKVASDSVQIGWQAFFSAIAVISINLGLLNFVPIPILDGGQIVLISVEAVLDRPIPEVAIENYQKIGFIMVLALFVIATYNDVGRFWASMLKSLGSMF